jgi:RNA binding exosome subunit
MGTFHWVRVRLFCYATEDEEKLHRLISEISGSDDIDAEISDGHHGNSMIIFSAEVKNEAECRALFGRLGKNIVENIIDNIDGRMDDDCTFYMRLDKQSAVSGIHIAANHGDVVSITCKIASHPARKSIAVNNLRKFLEGVLGSF